MKNFVYFGIGFGIEPWVERNGLIAVFCIFSALTFTFDASGIFVWYFGKRLRAKDTMKKIVTF
jgi:hypothetical protein